MALPLMSIEDPPPLVATSPKQTIYFSFPYIGAKIDLLRKEITKLIAKHYLCLNVRLSFNNSYKISAFFHFKDFLSPLMRSNVVYIYTCPKCSLGKYESASVVTCVLTTVLWILL